MLRCDLNRITMRGGLMLDYLFCVYVLLLPVPVISQCTLPASLRGTWVSSELGALNYTDDTIVAYPFVIPGTVESLDFQCQTHNATSFRYLLKATETFPTFDLHFDAYLCLELHQISSYKFWYHLGSNHVRIAKKRVHVVVSGETVDLNIACTRDEPYETGTFNTLIKEDAMDSHLAEATCPFELLHKFENGSLTSADGTKACSNISLDICTDRTDFRHVYDDSCDSSLMIAADGSSTCLLYFTNETAETTYLHVWNNDVTLKTGFNRINCYAYKITGDNVEATVYPGSCQEGQTATTISSPGIVVTYNSISETCQDEVQSGSQTMFFVAIILGALGFIACIIIVVCVIHKTRCRCLRQTKIASSSIESSTVTLSIDELESCDENYYQRNITKDGIPLVVDTKDTRPTSGKRSVKKNLLDENNENVIITEENEGDPARKYNKRRTKKKSNGANNEAIEDRNQIKGKGHKRLQKGVLSVNDEEQTLESQRDDIKKDGSGKKKSGVKNTVDNKQRQGKNVAARMKGKAGNDAREQGQEVEGDSDSGMGDLTIESNTGITSDEDANIRSGKGGKGDVEGVVKNNKISKFGSRLRKQSQGNVKGRSSADSAYLSGNIADNNLTNAENIAKSKTKSDFLDHSFIAKKPKLLKHAVEPILAPPAKVELLYEVEPRPTSSRLIFDKSVFLSKASLRVDEVFRE